MIMTIEESRPLRTQRGVSLVEHMLFPAALGWKHSPVISTAMGQICVTGHTQKCHAAGGKMTPAAADMFYVNCYALYETEE